ncbi:MAG: glycosyltransferase family 4 protein [Microbacteriaceae bacterium]|jgi:glycosyltransferase involved in cell wall biosynthesis|nr:glycosyltransferase family 4 protein [Microbacteriaceae bacterium]
MTGLIVHEWVSRSGGSERVLDSFSRMYPDADIFCLWNDAPGRYAAERVSESVLARTPLRGRKALALAAMPLVWKNVKDAGYDWVLSSSHAFSHQVSAGSSIPQQKHFTYVHTPARYVWTPELDGRGTSAVARLLASPLRWIDRTRARKLQNIAANSIFVRDRIRATWGMDATVIHPPVEVESLQLVDDWAADLGAEEAEILGALPAVFLLGASRFIPYKRLELAIAAGEATNIPVVLAGSGPDRAILAERAGLSSVPVTIVDAPSDALLRALMARAAVYVFPAVEDFGIMPVEAMALGTPVVVGAIGGAVESVIDGVTGAVLSGESPTELAEAVIRCLGLSPEACKSRAREFSAATFTARIENWMADA